MSERLTAAVVREAMSKVADAQRVPHGFSPADPHVVSPREWDAAAQAAARRAPYYAACAACWQLIDVALYLAKE